MTPNEARLIATADKELGAVVTASLLSARVRLFALGVPADQIEQALAEYAAALKTWRSQALAVVVGEVLGLRVSEGARQHSGFVSASGGPAAAPYTTDLGEK